MLILSAQWEKAVAVPSCFARLKIKGKSSANSGCNITYRSLSVDFIRVVKWKSDVRCCKSPLLIDKKHDVFSKNTTLVGWFCFVVLVLFWFGLGFFVLVFVLLKSCKWKDANVCLHILYFFDEIIFSAVGRSGFSGIQWILDDFAVAVDKVEHKTVETSAPPFP